MPDPIFVGFDTLREFMTAKGWQWPSAFFGGAGLSDVLDQVFVIDSQDKTSGPKHKVQMWLRQRSQVQTLLP